MCEGLEHDETGKPAYDGENHERMNNKRFGKLRHCQENETGYYDIGTADPDIVIVGWGAIAGSVREAVDRLTDEGLNVGGCIITMPWPFPLGVRERLTRAHHVLVVEANYQGQLAHIIQGEVAIPVQKLTMAVGGLIPVEAVMKRAKSILNVQEVHA